MAEWKTPVRKKRNPTVLIRPRTDTAILVLHMKPPHDEVDSPATPGSGRPTNASRLEILHEQRTVLAVRLEEIEDMRPAPDKLGSVVLSYSPSVSSPGSVPRPSELSFFSVRDATDVMWAVQQHKQHGFYGFKEGQVCVHKGPVVKKEPSGTWEERYVLLVPGRLIVLTKEDSDIPLSVITLFSGDERAEVLAGADPAELLLRTKEREWRFKYQGGAVERDTWIRAIKGERQLRQPIQDILGFGTPPPAPLAPWEEEDDANDTPADSPVEGTDSPGPVAAAATASAPASPKRASRRPPVLASAPPTPSGHRDAKASGAGGGAAWFKEKLGRFKLSEAKKIETMFAAQKAQMSWTDRKAQAQKIASDPRAFFQYVLQMRDWRCLSSSEILSSAEWAKCTPDGLLKGREKHLLPLDQALEAHNAVVESGTPLLENCRLVCSPPPGVFLHSVPVLSGFAFPGFDSQVFDVGKLAVVTPWQFFTAGGAMSFQEAEWQGALRSTSPAKEFMQSSPDVTQMFEDGKLAEAKQVLFESQLNVLHNISLAAYLRANAAVTKRNLRLSSGDVIWWANVMSTFEDDLNRRHQERWGAICYLYNPQIQLLEELFAEDTQAAGAGAADAKTAAGAASPSPSPAPSGNKGPSSVSTTARNSIIPDEGRLLLDPLRFLYLLRCYLQARQRTLTALVTVVKKWMGSHLDSKPDKPAKAARNAAIRQLAEIAARELADVNAACEILPSLSILQECIKGEQAKESGAVLSSFLGSRPQKEDLVKRGIIEHAPIDKKAIQSQLAAVIAARPSR